MEEMAFVELLGFSAAGRRDAYVHSSHPLSTASICVLNLIFDVNLIFCLCVLQIQDGSWHKTQFFFHTQDTNQLPVVQVHTLPHLKPGQQHFIESGLVCFLWVLCPGSFASVQDCCRVSREERMRQICSPTEESFWTPLVKEPQEEGEMAFESKEKKERKDYSHFPKVFKSLFNAGWFFIA